MKLHKTIIFFISALLLVSCSNKQNKIEFLSSDLTISENLNGKNLNGHTVSISKNGLELSNLFNGNITVLENIGAGTVTIKNSSIKLLTVESKSTIILDSTTTIEKIIIHDNAKITSTKTLEKKYSKRKDKNPENYVNQQPVINTVEIDYGLNPLFEGGKIENVVKLVKTDSSSKKDKHTQVVISDKSDAVIQKIESSQEVKKLTLVQDKSYTGEGVKIDVLNRPEDAGFMQIYLTDPKYKTNQIAWYSETATWDPDQMSRYTRDTFTYEYLNAGENYEFIVNYYKENKSKKNFTLIESSKIAVVPLKGKEFTFDSSNISMTIDPEAGIAKWNNAPEINIKKGSVINYSLNWGNYQYFGHLTRSATLPYAYNPVDFYKGMTHIDSSNFKNENVFIDVDYQYNGYTWDVYQSESFDYDISKAIINTK